QAHELVIVIPEPPKRRRVGRIAVLQKTALALQAASLSNTQKLECLLAREGVLDVAEVDELDELFKTQVGEKPPQRLVGQVSLEIPGRVDDRTDRHVNDSLLQTQPPHQTVA